MALDPILHEGKPARTEQQAMAQRWKVGETYWTRGSGLGRMEVRILATDATGHFPVIGLAECGGYEEPFAWKADGSYRRDGGTSSMDLTLEVARP